MGSEQVEMAYRNNSSENLVSADDLAKNFALQLTRILVSLSKNEDLCKNFMGSKGLDSY